MKNEQQRTFLSRPRPSCKEQRDCSRQEPCRVRKPSSNTLLQSEAAWVSPLPSFLAGHDIESAQLTRGRDIAEERLETRRDRKKDREIEKEKERNRI